MSADIDALAVAVQAQLNDPSRSWNGDFTATVGKTPQYTIAQLAELQVHVLPFGLRYETKSRGIDDVDLILEVSFQKKADKKPATGEDEPLINMGDELVALEKTIVQFLRTRANMVPPTYPTAYLKKTELVPLYDQGILTKERRFAGVLRLIYGEQVETE